MFKRMTKIINESNMTVKIIMIFKQHNFYYIDTIFLIFFISIIPNVIKKYMYIYNFNS